MSTQLEEREKSTTGNDDDLDHLWCAKCDPSGKTGLCGVNLENAIQIENEDEMILPCIVCFSLDKTHPCW